jgi:hypothetical protein
MKSGELHRLNAAFLRHMRLVKLEVKSKSELRSECDHVSAEDGSVCPQSSCASGDVLNATQSGALRCRINRHFLDQAWDIVGNSLNEVVNLFPFGFRFAIRVRSPQHRGHQVCVARSVVAGLTGRENQLIRAPPAPEHCEGRHVLGCLCAALTSAVDAVRVSLQHLRVRPASSLSFAHWTDWLSEDRGKLFIRMMVLPERIEHSTCPLPRLWTRSPSAVWEI